MGRQARLRHERRIAPRKEPRKVCEIDREVWERVRDIPFAKPAILKAAEENGAKGVEDLLAFLLSNGRVP